MKKIKFSLIALCLLLTINTFAQEETSSAGTSLSVGVELGLPMGDFGDVSKLGIGGSAKVAIPVITDGYVTVSAGYLSFSGKDIGAGFKYPTTSLIPLKAGFQYRFPGGFYIEPQFGYTIGKVKGFDSEGAFTYAGNLGFLLNNMLDLSARYEASSKDGSTTSFVGFRAAYNFSL